MGLLPHGGDGSRPPAPRLLAVLRPEAPEVRAGEQVRERLRGLLPHARRRDRLVDRGASR
jgi:hypothetical protein